MSKYKCIRAFSVPRCDDDGYPDDSRSYYIRKGSIWRDPDEDEIQCIDPLDAEITLIKDKGLGDYLNLTKRLFKENFVEV